MEFDLTQDQRDFAESLRAFFDAEYGHDRLRAVVDKGLPYDTVFWRAMVDDLELPGLAVDEVHGGSGASAVELVIALEQYGRALVSSPLLATVGLAVPAVIHAGNDAARATWLPRIARGQVTATWAVLGPDGAPDLVGAELHADPAPAGWVLSGSRSWVLDGATADVLVTVAATSTGPALFLVETEDADGLTRTPSEGLDPTLTLGEVSFRETPAHLISGDGAADGLVRALAEAHIALAAVQLGCLSATLDMSVAHASSRVQFGRPIGGFQAIKHRCADVFIGTETTRWAVYHAATLAADPMTGTGELAEAAHATSAYAAAASFRAAANLLQVLGGIGYTWEHDGQLYFKRATAAARLLGASTYHLDAVSAVIETAPSPAPGWGTTPAPSAG